MTIGKLTLIALNNRTLHYIYSWKGLFDAMTSSSIVSLSYS